METRRRSLLHARLAAALIIGLTLHSGPLAAARRGRAPRAAPRAQAPPAATTKDGATEAVEVIVPLLHDPDPQVRATAVMALGRLEETATDGLIVPLLGDSGKVQAATRKAKAKGDCYHRALTAGMPVDARCLARAETTFLAKFAAAEHIGGCVTAGDAATIEAKVDAFLTDLLSELPASTTTTTTTTAPPTTTTPATSTTTSTTLVSGCFTDTGDGTIHDTCTGLHWEKKTTTAGLQNVDNLYSWAGCCNGDCGTNANYCQPNAAAAATCAAQADGGTTGCNMCASGTCNVDPYTQGARTTVWDWVNQVNAANFAGHSDWRLPSEGGNNSPSTGANELETILLRPCGANPCIDSIFGPIRASSFYGSASTDAANPGSVWGVSFSNGDLGSGVIGKNGDNGIRAVR